MGVAGRVFVACGVMVVMISSPMVMSRSMRMSRRRRLLMAQLHAKPGADPSDPL
jgi:hypothetical protein